MIVTSCGVAADAEIGNAINATTFRNRGVVRFYSLRPLLCTRLSYSVLTRSDVNRDAFNDQSAEIVTGTSDQCRLAHTDRRMD